MKQIIMGTILSIFLQACSSKKLMQSDIIGTWKSIDGALIALNRDSTFVGKLLPAEYFTFFTSREDVKGKKINGSGTWKIESGQGLDEVKLNFTKMDSINVHGFYSVFIAGEKGILEKKAPWYLFVWKEEEGGEQYKFIKQ